MSRKTFATVDISQAVRDIRKLHPEANDKIFAKALAFSINDSAATGKTAAKKEIRQKYKIRAKSINIQKSRATTRNPVASIFTWGVPISMREFKPRIVRNKGVSVNIAGDRKLLPHAFMPTMKSGHKNVFARGHYTAGEGFKHRVGPGKPRTKKNKYNDLGITKLVSVSQSVMFANPTVLDKVLSRIDTTFERRIEYHIGRLIGGI